MNLVKPYKQVVFVLALTVLLISGGSRAVARDFNSRILTMGDSLLASHSISGRAVSNAVEKMLGEQVIDRSVSGARIIYRLPITGAMGLKIAKQYRIGKWDWIILNGGGNDIWFGCGCHKCDRKINRLISGNGRGGEIPRLVSKLRRTGARIIYVGYLRSPGVGSPIESCRDDGDELERRIDAMADADKGVYFLSLAKMVPFGDRSYHGFDMVHPSLKASREIGKRIADIIRR
ncbi:SGNH/GDSL hydrolase family protein [Profundibacter sp.]